MLGYLLRNRKVWGLTIGFSAYGYSFYLFLTWLPAYLVQTLLSEPETQHASRVEGNCL